MGYIVGHLTLKLIKDTASTIRTKGRLNEAIEYLALKKHGMKSADAERIASRGSHLGWSMVLCYKTMIFMIFFALFITVGSIVAIVENSFLTNPLYIFWLIVSFTGVILSFVGIGYYSRKYEAYLKKELNVSCDDVVDAIYKISK